MNEVHGAKEVPGNLHYSADILDVLCLKTGTLQDKIQVAEQFGYKRLMHNDRIFVHVFEPERRQYWRQTNTTIRAFEQRI